MSRIEQERHLAGRHRARVLLGALDGGGDLLAPPLELGLRKSRSEEHLGEEIQPQLQVFLQHGQGEGGAVPPRVTFEAAPHELDGLIELGARAPGRASSEHVGGEVGEPSRRRRIVHGARVQVDAHHHEGDGRALGHEQHHPVGQHLAMGEGRGRGGDDEGRHQQAHREPETSHGGSPQSRVFLNFNTARKKMTIPNTSKGTRLGQR
jgi:hypothetical protein